MRSPSPIIKLVLVGLGIVMAGLLGLAVPSRGIAWSILARTKPSRQFLLVQAVTYGFLLQIPYGWYIDLHEERFVWLLLGLSVAVRGLTDQRDRRHGAVNNSHIAGQLSSSAIER